MVYIIRSMLMYILVLCLVYIIYVNYTTSVLEYKQEHQQGGNGDIRSYEEATDTATDAQFKNTEELLPIPRHSNQDLIAPSRLMNGV